MRLLNLAIKNIASIEDVYIDFTVEPICSTNIFLITGGMGTGKTTILDAICLALYGTTPRIENANAEKKVKFLYGEALEVSAKDPINMIRRGTREGSVVLNFEDANGDLCVASWAGSLRNKTKNVKRFFTKGDITVSGEGNVNNATFEAIGLTFIQFCRTTMLAQGQFSEFLKSKTDEKASILEKLTNTTIYTRVGTVIARTTSEKTAQYKSSCDAVNLIQTLTDDARQQLHEEIEQLNKDLETLRSAETNRKQDFDYQQRLSAIQNDIKTIEEKISSIENQQKAPLFAQEEALIADWNNTAEARQWYSAHSKANGEINASRIEEQKLANTCSKLYAGYLYLQQWIDEQRDKLNNLNQKLSSQEHLKPIFDNQQTINAELPRAERLEQQSQSLLSEIKQMQDNQPRLNEAAKKAKEDVKQQQDNLKQCQQAVDKINEQIKTIDQDSLKQENARLSKFEKHLRVADTSTNSLSTLVQQADKTSEDLRLLKQKKTTEQTNLKEQKDAAKEALNHYNLTQQTLDRLQLQTSDAAATLRAQIHHHHSQNCPVCGQSLENIEIPAEEAIATLLRPLQDDLDKARQANSKAASAVSATEKYLQRLEEDINRADTAKNEADKALQEGLSKAIDHLEELNFPLLEQEKTNDLLLRAKNFLEDQRKNYDAQKQNIDDINKKLNNLQQELNNANTNLTNQTQVLADSRTTLNRYENDIKQNKDAIKLKQETVEQYAIDRKKCIDTVSPYFADQPQWLEQWLSDSNTFLSQWKEQAKDYNNQQELQQKISHNIEKTEMSLPGIDADMAAILKDFPSFDVDEAKPQKVENLPALLGNLRSQAASLSTRQKTLQQTADENANSLATFYKTTPSITPERLCDLANTPAEQITTLTKQHKSLHDELHSQRSILDSKKTERQTTLQMPHSPEAEQTTLDQLAQLLQETQQAIETATNERARRQAKIESDDNNRTLVADKMRQRYQIKQELDKWQTLNNLYGAEGGKRFNTIAQAYILDNMLATTNYYLSTLDKRYKLETVPGSLVLSLRDTYQPNYLSPVDGLSGGETFIVSLSLALALASLNNRALNIDTLFIDEGFGTLGKEEVDRVITLLTNMLRQQNKRVGIISHVESLAESIQVQIRASRTADAPTKLQIVDLRS